MATIQMSGFSITELGAIPLLFAGTAGYPANFYAGLNYFATCVTINSTGKSVVLQPFWGVPFVGFNTQAAANQAAILFGNRYANW